MGGNSFDSKFLDLFDLIHFGFKIVLRSKEINGQKGAKLSEFGVEALRDAGGGVSGVGVGVFTSLV